MSELLHPGGEQSVCESWQAGGEQSGSELWQMFGL